ncbi:hypothetical protein C8R45DRAFT_936365 [Mycena sanguinolenta]|nr:hypothetical protein C8R45DRAFT_936365 [Mycena sanguinolenta]
MSPGSWTRDVTEAQPIFSDIVVACFSTPIAVPLRFCGFLEILHFLGGKIGHLNGHIINRRGDYWNTSLTLPPCPSATGTAFAQFPLFGADLDAFVICDCDGVHTSLFFASGWKGLCTTVSYHAARSIVDYANVFKQYIGAKTTTPFPSTYFACKRIGFSFLDSARRRRSDSHSLPRYAVGERRHVVVPAAPAAATPIGIGTSPPAYLTLRCRWYARAPSYGLSLQWGVQSCIQQLRMKTGRVIPSRWARPLRKEYFDARAPRVPGSLLTRPTAQAVTRRLDLQTLAWLSLDILAATAVTRRLDLQTLAWLSLDILAATEATDKREDAPLAFALLIVGNVWAAWASSRPAPARAAVSPTGDESQHRRAQEKLRVQCAVCGMKDAGYAEWLCTYPAPSGVLERGRWDGDSSDPQGRLRSAPILRRRPYPALRERRPVRSARTRRSTAPRSLLAALARRGSGRPPPRLRDTSLSPYSLAAPSPLALPTIPHFPSGFLKSSRNPCSPLVDSYSLSHHISIAAAACRAESVLGLRREGRGVFVVSRWECRRGCGGRSGDTAEDALTLWHWVRVQLVAGEAPLPARGGGAVGCVLAMTISSAGLVEVGGRGALRALRALLDVESQPVGGAGAGGGCQIPRGVLVRVRGPSAMDVAGHSRWEDVLFVHRTKCGIRVPQRLSRAWVRLEPRLSILVPIVAWTLQAAGGRDLCDRWMRSYGVRLRAAFIVYRERAGAGASAESTAVGPSCRAMDVAEGERCHSVAGTSVAKFEEQDAKTSRDVYQVTLNLESAVRFSHFIAFLGVFVTEVAQRDRSWDHC